MARSFDAAGDRNYARLSQAGKDEVDFLNWATEQGIRREKGARQIWAVATARHLRSTAPDRFAKAIASWRGGRGDAVYTALVAMAEEVAASR